MKISTLLKVVISFGVLIGVVSLAPMLKSFVSREPSVLTTQYSKCDLYKDLCLVGVTDRSNASFRIVETSNQSTRQFVAAFDDEPPETLSITIEGKDMFMGVITRTAQKTSPREFVISNVVVPACTIDAEMVWIYRISLNYADRSQQIVFEVSNSAH